MSVFFDRGPKLELEQFRAIRDLVNAFCGIHYSDDARFIAQRRLRERLEMLGLESFEEYHDYLRFHPDSETELEHAAEALTTNETYFFREEYQLKAFASEVLPELHQRALRRGERHLSIWSAGCSSGEEVYTLGMLIDRSGLFHDFDVKIFGNDISRRVLQKARAAVYRPSSFRAMPPGYDEYFVDTPEGRQVHPRIRSMCHFGHINLLNHGRTAIVGKVHAVFCRNVLIYFDDLSRKKVVETFFHRLERGGYLFLGHSESLLNLSTSFELAHLSTDLAYRKPDPEAFGREDRIDGHAPRTRGR